MERSFGGFSYSDRASLSFYGDLFAARSKSGARAGILEVSSKLARKPGFAAALTRLSGQAGDLTHANVLRTRSVGRGSDGGLVVLTDPLDGACVLQLLEARGRFPLDVGLALTRAMIAAAAAGHSMSLVHGALHLRSLYVTGEGGVVLSDFVVGGALAAAARLTGSPSGVYSMTGYLAPELLDGAVADERSDVYALGAAMHHLLSAALPPGPLTAPHRVSKVSVDALASDKDQRFKNAVDMLAAFDVAIEADVCDLAQPDVLRALMDDEKQDEGELDDVVASLLGAEPVEPPPSTKKPSRSLTATLAGLGGGDSVPALEPEPDPEVDNSTGELTTVDPGLGIADPISQIINMSSPAEGERLSPPLPEPPAASAAGRSVTSLLDELAGEGDDSSKQDSEAALAAIASLNDEEDREDDAILAKYESDFPDASSSRPTVVERPPTPAGLSQPGLPGGQRAVEAPAPAASPPPPTMMAAEPAEVASPSQPTMMADPAPPPPAPVEAEAPVAPAPVEKSSTPRSTRRPASMDLEALAMPDSPKKSRGVLWMGLTAAALASLFVVLYTQSDAFNKDRVKQREEAQRRADEEALAAHLASQDKTAEVVVSSEEPDAAVWLLLGRTPVDTFPLPSSMLHEIRVEHEGYIPLDMTVVAHHWTGTEKLRKAHVSATLVAGTPKSPPPAFPPEPDTPPAPGGPGRGIIHVETSPPGAQAWLLVGFTPEVRLGGVRAGQDYEFKVLKDGHRPGVAVVKSGDWYLSGPKGPTHPSLTREVSLPAKAPAKKRKKRKRRR